MMDSLPTLVVEKISYYLWCLHLAEVNNEYQSHLELKHWSLGNHNLFNDRYFRYNYRCWKYLSLYLASGEWRNLNSIFSRFKPQIMKCVGELPTNYWFTSGLNHPAAYRSWKFGSRLFSEFDNLALGQE